MTARAIKFIDTHSHLQVERLDGHRAQWLAQAREAGLENILLCAGAPEDWERTLSTAHEWGLGAMLGIHPLWLDSTTPAELVGLRELAESLLDDPHFIGLGEVGLDGFEPGLDQHKAEQVFLEELKIARDLDLPLSIHVRRTASKTLGLLRRVYGSPGKTGFQPVRGAVHAFNGSDAEREAFLAFGLVLGFGGACTYDGSKRIRRHLSELADGAWVLETDAPDMPPSSRGMLLLSGTQRSTHAQRTSWKPPVRRLSFAAQRLPQQPRVLGLLRLRRFQGSRHFCVCQKALDSRPSDMRSDYGAFCAVSDGTQLNSNQ